MANLQVLKLPKSSINVFMMLDEKEEQKYAIGSLIRPYEIQLPNIVEQELAIVANALGLQ